LHYQPKAHLATAEVRSVEALVRWEHPTRGLIMPGDFIPLAQETGLMTPLTAYVLEEALRACRAWRADGLPLSVAVNVSERNLLDAGFPDQVESLLRSVGADATWLELELTESAALRDPVRAQHVLDRLAGRGIRISIDDFGSGYTSLSQLTRLPIAEIKIDRSFVGDMPSQKHAVAVVRMVVEFARSVGLDVVAEGVESRETWEQLAALGCTLAQGYFLSRPLPEAALLRWLARHDATGRRVTPAATCR
jgi:EAL domain-containing protein (putative c-di-GMP-specific phosphodiesterase class I)